MQTTAFPNQTAGNPPPVQPPEKKRGCLFYGCITSLVVLLLIVIAAVGICAKLVRLAKEYTSEQPMKIESVVLPPAQMAELNARIAAFRQALKEDKPARLALTADEINAKLSSKNELTALGLKAHVEIEGDRITAAISMPFPIHRFGLEGRYINGTAKIRTALEIGRLLMYVDDLDMAGKKLPEQVMTVLRTRNLAENAMKNPETAATIAKLKTLTVQNGTIIFEK